MNGLLESAREVQDFCEGQGWAYCFIGGIAVQRWGEPRVTRDVDLTLLVGFGSEDRFIEPLLQAFAARITDAAEFARQRRVLLLRSVSGTGIDVSLGALPFEEAMVNRASLFHFGDGIDLRTCSAEDLLVLKLFAARPTDIRDAEGIVARQRGALDWQYVDDQLRPLAEMKDASILDTMERLRHI